jgi:hypothetical protein
VLSIVIACLAIAVLSAPASAVARVARPGSALSGGRSATKAKVACKRVHPSHIRCTMTLRGGAGVSGKVKMRISRGKLVVAVGRGRIMRGKATLTMHVLHRMTPGRYTVSMVVALKSTRTLRLR